MSVPGRYAASLGKSPSRDFLLGPKCAEASEGILAGGRDDLSYIRESLLKCGRQTGDGRNLVETVATKRMGNVSDGLETATR